MIVMAMPRLKVAWAALTTGNADHDTFKRGMNITIIGRLFLSILEDFVRLIGLFELVFGLGVVGIAVRVQLLRLLAIGLFDLGRVGPFGDAKRLVIIAFCHCVPLGNGKRPARFKGPV